MPKYTEFDLENAFNAGRIVEGGKPESDSGRNELFGEWLYKYTGEDDEQ